MNIFGTFEHGIEVEQALEELMSKWVRQEHILVVFMDHDPAPVYFKARTKNVYSNAFEVGMASATGTAVIGASIGFILLWGPILWGLIAAIIGFCIGFVLYALLNKKNLRPSSGREGPAILVVIQCADHQATPIQDLLWKYQAQSVGQADS